MKKLDRLGKIEFLEMKTIAIKINEYSNSAEDNNK